MHYNYESLLDEHFQHLCQSLILDSFPHLQCMPVGMPDGGRDALASDHPGGAIVFQVKFARNPLAIKDPVGWLQRAVDGEREKIAKLASRGASDYVLITNLPGTSHLGTGRIDKLDDYLKDQLPLHAVGWWRDELDRRLDRNFDLKLLYPSLLSGTDMLRLIAERFVPHASGVDDSGLRAYLAYHFERDNTVRFKQAELSASALFQIFVDVPVTVAPPSREGHLDRGTLSHLTRVARAAYGRRIPPERRTEQLVQWTNEELDLITEDLHGNPVYDYIQVGAADTLLDASFCQARPLVVLEGAPGQGKSTLTQYLAQVHRARLLGSELADTLPDHHRASPISIPLRIELRDLSQWLNGINPWADEPQRKHTDQASLEAALAAHIRRFSGGAAFQVRDLHRLLESLPVLLLLDGLDEVADLDDRRKVVDEILSAVTRLSVVANRLNVLVTSRPTVISNIPTFPGDRFASLKLSAIHRDLALEYTDRWAEARNLNEKDRAEVRRILAAKMTAPHMAELAKNTMQLSILLSLIYLRGESLPDKRTELYDTYVDTFFNRESEKSAIVRQHRRLLIDIHRYIAFYLHASAEGKRTSGRIATGDLEKLVGDYLRNEGRPTTLVNDLVLGTVERVVALVSRVEGTYEFEVQPLREYFAARFLYDTAPYSPPGRNRIGTKPDRFDAVARNPYWLNVTRFFAGCFSKGELLDLSERVCTLIESDSDKLGTYGRNLAIAFLQDWVFTQSVTATNQVVSAILDDVGIRIYGSPGPSRYNIDGLGTGFVLSEDSGGSQLVRLLWDKLLAEGHRTEWSDCLCVLLRRHLDPARRTQYWLDEAIRRRGDRLEGWFAIGVTLNVLDGISVEALDRVLLNVAAVRLPRILAHVAYGGGEIHRLGRDRFDDVIRRCLNVPSAAPTFALSPVTSFLSTVSPDLWAMIVQHNAEWESSPRYQLPQKPDPMQNAIDACRRSFYEAIGQQRYQIPQNWATAFEIMDQNFGKVWTTLELAVIYAALRDPAARWAGAGLLFDATKPLTSRIRFAKRRGKDSQWWSHQGDAATDDLDRAFWLAAVYAWAAPGVFVDLLPMIDSFLRRLGPDLRTSVAQAWARSHRYSERARRPLAISSADLYGTNLSIHTLALIVTRLTDVDGDLLAAFAGRAKETWIASARFWVAATLLSRSLLSSSEFLKIAEEYHAIGARHYPITLRYIQSRDVLREMAPQILDNSRLYPTELVLEAHASSRKPRRSRPILLIAEEESWMGQMDGDSGR